MNLRLIVPRNALFTSCPKCKEELMLERMKSKNKTEKVLLTIFRFKKYHCKSCKWSGSLFLYAFSKNVKKILINYLILFSIAVIACIVLSFLVKNLLSP